MNRGDAGLGGGHLGGGFGDVLGTEALFHHFQHGLGVRQCGAGLGQLFFSRTFLEKGELLLGGGDFGARALEGPKGLVVFDLRRRRFFAEILDPLVLGLSKVEVGFGDVEPFPGDFDLAGTRTGDQLFERSRGAIAFGFGLSDFLGAIAGLTPRMFSLEGGELRLGLGESLLPVEGVQREQGIAYANPLSFGGGDAGDASADPRPDADFVGLKET